MINLAHLQKSTKQVLLSRSKARWTEENEKNTSYFLALEKHNGKNKTIFQLKKDDVLIDRQKDILSEIQSYYQTLYTQKESCDLKFYENKFCTNIPFFTEVDSDNCEKEIEIPECLNALKELVNGKSPGSDGFPADFYKFFWTDIKYLVVNSIKYAFEKTNSR